MTGRPLRRDAARNRQRLLESAGEVLAAQGLDASLEEVARRAKVSIGTLYNHFPTRADLIDAVVPHRLVAIDALAAEADADPDPWNALVGFIRGLLAQQAADRGLREALNGGHPGGESLIEACHRGLNHLSRILARAHQASAVRPDVDETDITHLIWSLSMLGATVGAEAARRCLDLVLEGIRPR